MKWYKGFSFSQLTANSDGKTSASGTAGLVIICIGTFGFFLGCIDKVFVNHDVDIITQSILFTTLGAGLLGLRKAVARNGNQSLESGEGL